MTAFQGFAGSRTGATFGVSIEQESDGSLVLISEDSHGYRSAHRDFAAAYFDHRALWCMNRLSWVNSHGVRVVMTRWNTQEYRRAPLDRTKFPKRS